MDLGKLSRMTTAISLNLSPGGSNKSSNDQANSEFEKNGLNPPDDQVGFDGVLRF